MSALYRANDGADGIDASASHFYSKNYELIGVKDGESYNLEIKGRKFQIDIIKCDHGVPCVGYGFNELRTKLKKIYVGRSGAEIKALRNSGEDINEIVKLPVFCFIGDTTSKVISDTAIVQYRTIIMECTFITEDETERAIKTKHTHWNDIEEFIDAHPENQFVLYHFSQRYRETELKDFFIKKDKKNVHAWISNN